MTAQPMFLASRACRIPRTPLAVVVVSGNGSTFVQQVAFHQLHGVWLRNPAEVRRSVVQDRSSPLLLDVDAASRPAACVLVAPWRHPVDRLARWARGLSSPRWRSRYEEFHDLPDASWDRLVDFISWELGKSDPRQMAEGVRPQSLSYRLDAVDLIVPASALPRLIRSYGAALDPFHRLLRPAPRLRAARMPAPVAGKLERLYRDDVEIGRLVTKRPTPPLRRVREP